MISSGIFQDPVFLKMAQTTEGRKEEVREVLVEALTCFQVILLTMALPAAGLPYVISLIQEIVYLIRD